ncbi:unnamed protein product [marine sediment metagenome]|uniref:Class I SAM-dependent methyltransferase n=1 Tax=marine sediment metagenome TaxID=412755 RepID=X1SRA7_9ZZZZ
MINLNQLVVEGRFIGVGGDMKAFACLLAGLVIASDARLVFEIGTGRLVSGRAFLYGLEKTKGTLISCDPAKKFNFSHPQFQFMQKTSNEIAKTWNRPIDILFIDGNHRYEEVLFDYKTFAPFVKKNGLIIFHDIRHPVKKIQGPKKKVSENATEN